jgi:hypothetical protein
VVAMGRPPLEVVVAALRRVLRELIEERVYFSCARAEQLREDRGR